MGAVQSVTCQETLDELQEKLEVKFAYDPQRVRAAAHEVRNYSQVVTITNSLKVVAADADDDKVLECAVVGGATDVVTGDRRHLLPMGGYQGISIVTGADFLALAPTP